MKTKMFTRKFMMGLMLALELAWTIVGGIELYKFVSDVENKINNLSFLQDLIYGDEFTMRAFEVCALLFIIYILGIILFEMLYQGIKRNDVRNKDA